MGFLKFITQFMLPLTPTSAPTYPTNITSFTLQTWSPDTPLHQQPISFYPTSDTEGYLGFSLATPPPPSNISTFVQRQPPHTETSISVNISDNLYLLSVKANGEFRYAPAPNATDHIRWSQSTQAPYGIFALDYFTSQLDDVEYDILDFLRPTFIYRQEKEHGTILACPGKNAESKDYKLHIAPPKFRLGGCTTLEFLVLENKRFTSTMPGDKGGEEEMDIERELI